MTQQIFDVSDQIRIELRNCHNRVTVIGWENAQRVSADYAARQEGDAIIVEDADKVILRVPRRAAVNVADSEADVRLEDIDGRVGLSHIGGDVSLRNLRGDVLARDLDGDVGARDVSALCGEGVWDGDVSLHSVRSFQAEKIDGSLTLNEVESVSVGDLEGDLTARGVKSLKGEGAWEGDVVLRNVGAAEIREIEGDVSLSELGAVKIETIHGDLNASSVRGALEMDEVKGFVNLREVGGNVSLRRVNGDFIASGIRNALLVEEIGGDAVVSFVGVTPTELRADGDVVFNLPEHADAELELDAPHGHLVAHADIEIDHEDQNHIKGKLGSGGVKIRAESSHGDLILKAGGADHHHVHEPVRDMEFADMGRRISREVRDSMRESFRGWRANVQPNIKIKTKSHWGEWHEKDADREEEVKPRGPAAGSPERQAILDAIARGELTVDDAIQKLRGE